MRAVLEVDPGRPDEAALGQATAALVVGELVVFPTETVYGIAARPDDPSATRRLFVAKRRPSGLNLPVLAPSAEAAWRLANPDARADCLAAAFWPGPLTIVLPRSPVSLPWHLGDAEATVGVRVPDHPLTRALLERAGPLAATSANLSGRPPLESRDDLLAAFGDAVAVYLVLAPGSTSPSGVPSTIVDLTVDPFRVLRAGPIVEADIRTALREETGGAVHSVD